MKQQTVNVAKILFNMFHQGLPDDIEEILPKKLCQQLKKNPIESNNIVLILNPYETVLERMHYSWLPDFIKRLPRSVQSLAIASLPEEEGQKLCQLMRHYYPEETPSASAQTFIRQLLATEILYNNPTPPEFLPYKRINDLGTLTKKQLLHLINLLGLKDLAETVRTIVNTKALQVIYSCLKPEEQKYLHLCSSQQEKMTTNKIDLSRWKGDCASLRKVIHRRGLVRLGKALTFQSEALRDAVLHIMDVGRAKVVQRNCFKEKKEEISQEMAQQIITLLPKVKEIE